MVDQILIEEWPQYQVIVANKRMVLIKHGGFKGPISQLVLEPEPHWVEMEPYTDWTPTVDISGHINWWNEHKSISGWSHSFRGGCDRCDADGYCTVK